jgi:hypothetical protein
VFFLHETGECVCERWNGKKKQRHQGPNKTQREKKRNQKIGAKSRRGKKKRKKGEKKKGGESRREGNEPGEIKIPPRT